MRHIVFYVAILAIFVAMISGFANASDTASYKTTVFTSSYLSDLNTSTISSLMKKARKTGKKMTIPKYKHNKQIVKAINAYHAFRKKQSKQISEYEKQILKSRQFISAMKAAGISKKTVKNIDKLTSANLLNYQKIFIFISSSMPIATIRTYVQEAVALGTNNIQIVMRGMIGNIKHITPTSNFIFKCLKVEPSCQGINCKIYNYSIDINPILFRKYDIKRVPAIVYDPNYQPYHSADPVATKYYIMHGDVPLGYVMDLLKSKGIL